MFDKKAFYAIVRSYNELDIGSMQESHSVELNSELILYGNYMNRRCAHVFYTENITSKTTHFRTVSDAEVIALYEGINTDFETESGISLFGINSKYYYQKYSYFFERVLDLLVFHDEYEILKQYPKKLIVGLANSYYPNMRSFNFELNNNNLSIARSEIEDIRFSLSQSQQLVNSKIRRDFVIPASYEVLVKNTINDVISDYDDDLLLRQLLFWKPTLYDYINKMYSETEYWKFLLSELKRYYKDVGHKYFYSESSFLELVQNRSRGILDIALRLRSRNTSYSYDTQVIKYESSIKNLPLEDK